MKLHKRSKGKWVVKKIKKDFKDGDVIKITHKSGAVEIKEFHSFVGMSPDDKKVFDNDKKANTDNNSV